MEITKLVALIVIFLVFLTPLIAGCLVVVSGISSLSFLGLLYAFAGVCLVYGAQRAFFCVLSS